MDRALAGSESESLRPQLFRTAWPKLGPDCLVRWAILTGPPQAEGSTRQTRSAAHKRLSGLKPLARSTNGYSLIYANRIENGPSPPIDQIPNAPAAPPPKPSKKTQE
ncbi:hypothetical protein O181_040003 [Austropuccinia psidii MF-1]|uniref:Uncharacterized protein n=1 Tax=Austropuccinia psidii MF-1 TaxID=1389203 RepID=A0A9Q3HCG4_9BASI|nr:hypothetical protein [Austropuccinia psidii MF-1]